MPGFFPQGFLVGPRALDVSDGGRVAVLDHGGERLVLSGTQPLVIALDFRGLRCRFHGESVILLGAAGELRTINAAGVTMNDATTHARATNLAVMKSGSVVVTFRGGEPTFERLGAHPLAVSDNRLDEASAVAAASGGLWIAGDGRDGPLALLFRPRSMAFDTAARVALPAAPEAAAIGPDAALWLVVAPGDRVVRVEGGQAEPPRALPGPVSDLARAGRRLLAAGAEGLVDLTGLVPSPPEPSSPPDLPACGP